MPSTATPPAERRAAPESSRSSDRRIRVLFAAEFLPQEPLGMQYLSRALKDAGHETRALFFPDRHFVEKVREYRPHVLAWGPVTTGVHNTFRDLNLVVREKVDTFSIFGGPHPTFVPDYVEEPGIDAICQGEGEYAFVELANRMARGEDVTTVPNLHVKKDGRIHRNAVGPLVQELDSLGFPDREVVYEAGGLYRQNPRKVFVTQRGCPYTCSFCFHHAWRIKVYKARNEEYVRKRSVEHAIQELERVKDAYPLRFVHFVDDVFNIDDEWIDEFCELYPKRVGLPFDVILMAALTKRDQMKKLNRAGCISARIAFETANDYLRNKVYRKGGVTYEQLVNAAKYIKDAGIRLTSLNILGGPMSTIEDDFETLRLNVKARVDFPLVSLLQPYPQTDVAEMTKNMGYAVDEYDQFSKSFKRGSTIQHKNRHEFENLHKLFPILVRFPSLVPAAKWLIKPRFMGGTYVGLYGLWTEYLGSEQNASWARALGMRGPRSWAIVDFFLRVSAKITLRAYMVFSEERAKKKAMEVRMAEATVDAHLD